MPCDPVVTLIHYKKNVSVYEFSVNKSETVFRFEGDKDRQPNLENYYLSVNKAMFGVVHGNEIDGSQGHVEGECHMRQNADGTVFYDIKCDVYDRRTGMSFNFVLSDISDFHVDR